MADHLSTWPELIAGARIAGLTLVGPLAHNSVGYEVGVYRVVAGQAMDAIAVVRAIGPDRDARLRALVAAAIQHELDAELRRKVRAVGRDRSVEPTGSEP